MIWILANWKLILGGGFIAVLSLLLILAKADARSERKRADQNEALYQVEAAKHAVTRTSLNMALTAIDDQNAAVQKLAADSDARIKSAADAQKAAQEAARASEGVARALEASAAVARPDARECPPSDTFWNQSRKDL
jgi:predicted  nucleic acid-binding Zn-ribbon protein